LVDLPTPFEVGKCVLCTEGAFILTSLFRIGSSEIAELGIILDISGLGVLRAREGGPFLLSLFASEISVVN